MHNPLPPAYFHFFGDMFGSYSNVQLNVRDSVLPNDVEHSALASVLENLYLWLDAITYSVGLSHILSFVYSYRVNRFEPAYVFSYSDSFPLAPRTSHSLTTRITH